MSLRPRQPNQAPPTPELDTPAAHYTERLDLGSAAVAHGHIHDHAPKEIKEKRGGPGTGFASLNAASINAALRDKSSWAQRVFRRNGGRLGLSQRAWLAVSLVIGFLLLTKLLVPTGTTVSNPTIDEISELEPRNYVNTSATDPAPFDFCPVFGPGDAIAARRGQYELLRSRVHLGTGARVQRVLRKAMSGNPTTISVLGGSISACHGAGDDPIAPECFPARFYNWWNSVFPNRDNELTNGAVKRTDSAYYAYCSKNHLPDRTDLVILEFDTSDPNDHEYLQYFELLVRSILQRPEHPAVIIFGHFSPQVQAQNGYAGPELLHNAVAQFYDVPHISAKGVMYDSYFERPDRALSDLYVGSHLSNHHGHDMMADVLISYMMSQICAGWSALLGYSFNVPQLSLKGDSVAGGKPVPFGGMGLRPNQEPDQKEESSPEDLKDKNPIFDVPPMRLNDRPVGRETFREAVPYCVAASDLVNPLPNSIFYGSGWATYHPPKTAADDRHYWYADQPTSRLRIQVRISSGDVGIYFLQVPMDKPAGRARCWVDDNTGGAKTLEGHAETEESIATLQMIDHGVASGSHYVECMLDGEPGGPSAPFKILGIFTT